MVNAIEGELLFASGMRLSLADTAEVYVLPPAFATPGAAVTMPLRRDELTGYDCVWVEPISMDATLRDEFRGWSRCTFAGEVFGALLYTTIKVEAQPKKLKKESKIP